MTSLTSSAVRIGISPDTAPSIPSWFGEVAAFAQVLAHTGILKAIQDQVRFARARFGHYEVIDFVTVLIGYILSGEPTLLAFYERLAPWARRSWPCLAEISCLIARPCLVFLLPSISQRWRLYARSFRRICLRASRFPLLVACSTGQTPSFSWSMWMERGNPPVNARFPRPPTS